MFGGAFAADTTTTTAVTNARRRQHDITTIMMARQRVISRLVMSWQEGMTFLYPNDLNIHGSATADLPLDIERTLCELLVTVTMPVSGLTLEISRTLAVEMNTLTPPPFSPDACISLRYHSRSPTYQRISTVWWCRLFCCDDTMRQPLC